MARQTAYFGHHFHEGLHILQDGALKLHRKEQDDEEISAKMFGDTVRTHPENDILYPLKKD